MNPKLQMMLLAQSTLTATAAPQDGPRAGRKRAANVSIDEQVLAEAKQMGINLSQTLESVLREMIRQTRIREWSKTNQKAVGTYNQFVTGGSGR
ncbi:MAG: type II toxin-antitoxin system CcdA family antitoxin [Rhizomicrobium sp.]